MRISVLVPTYRRPKDLLRCLEALAGQICRPAEIIVTVRDTDDQTWEVLRDSRFAQLGLLPVTVKLPGVIHAMNHGLAAVQTEIVAITDDDAAPHPDWTQRIIAHFEQRPDLAGVGGRDFLHVGGVLLEGSERIVGIVPLIGKHVGNHHLGVGGPREVDTLKGVNGAYRTSAIRPIGFDTRLRGAGAQYYWELSLGLALKRAGWKLLYDPLVAVDHFQAPRLDGDQRVEFSVDATQTLAYNETLVRMDQLSSGGRVVFMCWAILVGTRVVPGCAQWVRFAPQQGSLAGARLRAALTGRFAAWRDARASIGRQRVSAS